MSYIFDPHATQGFAAPGGQVSGSVFTVRKDADAALDANGQYTLLQADGSGWLKVVVKALPAISGSVSVSNLPATQPVSGPLTDTQLRATPVPVSSAQSGTWTTARTWALSNGTDAVTAVQGGAWSFAVNNFPATTAVTQGTSPWVVSGAVTATVAGTKTPSDAFANPTDGLDTLGFNMLWNGASWDRWKSSGNNADAVGTAALGCAAVLAYGQVFNGTTWDRAREVAAADAQAPAGILATGRMVWNGATWDRGPGNTKGEFVQGNVASGVAVTANPMLNGGLANSAVPAAVAAGQAVAAWLGLNGRLRAIIDRPNVSGIYLFTIQTTEAAAADAATGGRLWIVNPIGSSKLIALRRACMQATATAASVALTSPTFTLERITFTGTDTGTAVSICKRDSNDPTATAVVSTTSTGLTITAGAVFYGTPMPAVITAVANYTSAVDQYTPPEDERVVLRPGEGLVLRQSQAGTGTTRIMTVDFCIEEFTALSNA